jgi:hypothetical protein
VIPEYIILFYHDCHNKLWQTSQVPIPPPPQVDRHVLIDSLQTGTFTTRRNGYAIPAGRSLIVPHWQLRDLVQCTLYRPQSVFYVNNAILREVDLETGKITRAVSTWDFAPRCFGVMDDYVVAGNEHGWIQGQSLNRNMDDVMKSQLSTSINNNICLYTALDGTRKALVGYVLCVATDSETTTNP